MSLLVGKEKSRRNIIFLEALKENVLILMYCLLSETKKKIKWIYQMEGYIPTLAIKLCPHSVMLTFQSVFFTVSERNYF